jgi:hypothetical protein
MYLYMYNVANDTERSFDALLCAWRMRATICSFVADCESH